MSLIICRASEEVPFDYIKSISKTVSDKMQLPTQEVEPAVNATKRSTFNEARSSVASKLNLGSAFVTAVFSADHVPDDFILGADRSDEKVALVTYSGNRGEDLAALFHVLGHCFGAWHCANCTMNPNYVSFDVEPADIKAIFCDRCTTTIQRSDLFLAIQKKRPPDGRKRKESTLSDSIYDDSFPPYDLLSSNQDEFMYRAFRHYRFGEDEK